MSILDNRFLGFSEEREAEIAGLINKHGGSDKYAAKMAAGMKPFVMSQVEESLESSFAMETRILKPGESSKIYVEPDYDATVVDAEGNAFSQKIHPDEIDPPEFKVDAKLVFRKKDLRQGKLRPIGDQQKTGEKKVQEKIEIVNFNALRAAVPESNIIISSGGVMTETAARQAVTIIEDQSLQVGGIYSRAKHINFDMKDFKMSDKILEEYLKKGVVAIWNGATVTKTIKMPENEILFVPNEFVGACLITDFDVDQSSYVKDGHIGIYIEASMKIAVGKARHLALVKVVN